MDNLSYLNQISATTPSAAPPAKEPLLSPKLKKFLLIIIPVIIVLFIGLFVMNSINTKKNTPVSLTNLAARINTLTTAINTYGKNVKSTSLRSASSSLHTILHGMNVTITSISGGKLPKNLTSLDSAHAKDLNESLETARLAGTTDRVYAFRMTYEIELLITMLESLSKQSPVNTTTTFLLESSDNLKNLLPTFESASS